MLSFENTDYLWGFLLLIPVIALFFFCLRQKNKTIAKIGDPALVKRLTGDYSPEKFRNKFWIVLLALALGILAAANLEKPGASSKEKRAGVDIMVALDVSKSMLSSDIKPTRLDQAKRVIGNLINNLEDNRLGLVVFAGQAVLQMPLTDDIGAAKMYLSNATPDAVPVQGTEIGDALTVCNNAFNTQEKKYKAIVLISDGEDHDPRSEAVIKTLRNSGVVVYTIGVGTAGGAPIMDPQTNEYKVDANGQTVISKLNEKELEEIANATGGKYARLDNDLSAPRQIANAINSMEKKLILSGKAPGEQNFTSFFPLFLALMIVLLVIEIFVSERKRSLI